MRSKRETGAVCIVGLRAVQLVSAVTGGKHRRAFQLSGVDAPDVNAARVWALERDVIGSEAPALRLVRLDAQVPAVGGDVRGPAEGFTLAGIDAKVGQRRGRLVPQPRQHVVIAPRRRRVLPERASHPQRVILPQRLHRRPVPSEGTKRTGRGGDGAGEGLRHGEPAARRHDSRSGTRLANLPSLRGFIDGGVLPFLRLGSRTDRGAAIRAEPRAHAQRAGRGASQAIRLPADAVAVAPLRRRGGRRGCHTEGVALEYLRIRGDARGVHERPYGQPGIVAVTGALPLCHDHPVLGVHGASGDVDVGDGQV